MVKLVKLIGEYENFAHKNYTLDFAEVMTFTDGMIFFSRSLNPWKISLCTKMVITFESKMKFPNES